MKSFKLIASMVIALSLTINIVSAAERVPGASSSTAYYRSSTDKVVMESEINSGTTAWIVQTIQAIGDFYRNSTFLGTVATTSTGNTNSKTALYSALPDPGFYDVDGYGTYILSTAPSTSYYDSSQATYVHNPNKSLEYTQEDFEKYKTELYTHIASSFNIKLEEYKKVDLYNLEEADITMKSELIEVYFNIPKEIGDKRPELYLRDETNGIIIMQKLDGTNKIYYLELVDDGWIIESEDFAKGKAMNL